ncbi:MAG TPA: M20/M25/M40 family metallo-hydrolase [Acetobacteraceae bacterium]|jgi:acetylornithine deacetylase/succinyl-diaminopimelate desuccinylase-like protein|nr:M20/M25/M40 family metallo-hydrolase [Acetobacteraceae bacterium]
MPGDRDAAIGRARSVFDDGGFVERLRELVSYPTESQVASRRDELYRYCDDGFGPLLRQAGFATQVHDNPRTEFGPFLVGTRIEDPSLPTMLVYGHGDVVRAMPERWRSDLDPWRLHIEGDRIYGRGVVDNKGQHLLALEALSAVIAERGGLGFNVKFLVETGEETGSPGLLPFIRQRRDELAADAFIALDGPRQSMAVPDITLGTRGGVALDLVIDLREGSHHSGHWGGILADPGFLMAHALACIVSRDGRILVPGWTPGHVPNSVRDACARVVVEDLPGTPVPDPWWGEPGLSRPERIYMWTSVIVLASITGQPEAPVNAVSGTARARIQVRHTVDVSADTLVPDLRAHLDAHGLQMVEIVPVLERDMFLASRTDPGDPWVQRVVRSMALTAGRQPNVIPTNSASGPSEFFKAELGVPVMWIPHSYGGCGQHGPDEHGLGTLFRDGLGLMAGVFWDLGEA